MIRGIEGEDWDEDDFDPGIEAFVCSCHCGCTALVEAERERCPMSAEACPPRGAA